jgi:hypothetical protein
MTCHHPSGGRYSNAQAHRTSKTGSELFIVDNSESDWKVLRYLHDWRQFSKAIDVARTQLNNPQLLWHKKP